MNKKLLLLLLPVALFALACGSPTNSGGGTQIEGVGPTGAAASAAPEVKSTAPFVAFKDGQYEVGNGPGQVKPGKYKTTVPNDSIGCYWERQKDFEGNFNSILANDNVAGGSPAVVTIKSTDKGFKSERCGEWKLS